jgi:hypothetical protein
MSIDCFLFFLPIERRHCVLSKYTLCAAPDCDKFKLQILRWTAPNANAGLSRNVWLWIVQRWSRLSQKTWAGFVDGVIFVFYWQTTDWAMQCCCLTNTATITCLPSFANWVSIAIFVKMALSTKVCTNNECYAHSCAVQCASTNTWMRLYVVFVCVIVCVV